LSVLSPRDHSGGNKKLVELVAAQGNAKLEVYGGDDRIEALTKKVPVTRIILDQVVEQ
jgi:hypothetical protein